MNKPWTRPRTSWHELNKQHHCDIWTKMILAFLQSKTFIATQIKLQSTKNLALSLCQAISRWQGSFWQLCNQLKLNLVINFALSEYLSDLQPYPWILKPVFPSLNCDNMSSYTITNALINWITSQKQEMPLLTVFSKHFIFPSVLQRALFYVPVCNFALPCFIIPPRPPIVKVLKQEVKPLCWSDHETTVLQTVNLKRGKGNRQKIWRKSSSDHHFNHHKIKMASTHQLLNSLMN